MAVYKNGEFDFDKDPEILPPLNNTPPVSDETATHTPGVYDIIGTSVPLAEDGSITGTGLKKLYALLSIYRNKQYETFRYILVNDQGYIKDHVAVSALHPARAPISPSVIGSDHFTFLIKQRAIQINCKVILVHNHPSGNVEASSEDREVNNHLKKIFGECYLGHIILDHGNISFYNTISNDFSPVTITPRPGADPLVPKVSNDYTGVQINSPQQESFIRAAIHLDSGEKWNDKDWVPILFLSQNHRVQSLHYYHLSEFTGENAETTILNKSLFISRSDGSTNMFALPTDDAMFNTIHDFSKKIPLFMDSVYNGRSLYRESGITNNLSNFLPLYSTFVSSFAITDDPHNIPNRTGDIQFAATRPDDHPRPDNPQVTVPAAGLAAENTHPRVRSPSTPPDLRATFQDVEIWAQDAFPSFHKQYTILQHRLSITKKEAARDSIQKQLRSMRADFTSYYKIFHLNQFDETEYHHNLTMILKAKTIEDFPPTPSIHIGFLPPLYREIGYPSLPLFITPRHLYLITQEKGILQGNYLGLAEQFEKLPELLKDPYAIYDLHKDYRTLTVLNSFDTSHNPLGLCTTPLAAVQNSAQGISVNASLLLDLCGIKKPRQKIIGDDFPYNVLYIKKDAGVCFPSESAATRQDNSPDKSIDERLATITPAPDDLGPGIQSSHIAAYKQSVNTYVQNHPSHFVHEHNPPYPDTLNLSPKEHTMADQFAPSPASDPVPLAGIGEAHDSPLPNGILVTGTGPGVSPAKPTPDDASLHFSLEYLKTLLSIRDRENRYAFHRDFTTYDAYSSLENFPDFSHLPEQYRELCDTFSNAYPRESIPEPPRRFTEGTPAELTPLQFLSEASSLKNPQEYRQYYQEHIPSFIPGDIRSINNNDDTLALFDNHHAFPLALSPNKPPYNTALFKQAGEQGILIPGTIPDPRQVDTFGMEIVSDAYANQSKRLSNNPSQKLSQDEQRTRLEYLEMLIQTPEDLRKNLHRYYTATRVQKPNHLSPV